MVRATGKRRGAGIRPVLTAPGATCGLLLLALLSGPVAAFEWSARIKGFASGRFLPAHDLQRHQDGTPAWDGSIDLRLMFRRQTGALTWLADHSLMLTGGDSFGLFQESQRQLDQAPLGDSRRLLDLTWRLDQGDQHRLLGRWDRLALQWRQGDWSVRLGRQALTWGNGQVFQPLDLFSPFAPTTVDRDYKAGDDLLLVERLLADGGDVQLLVVARRNADRAARAASSALKWRGIVGQAELELLTARHYGDSVFGLGWRRPLGAALARSDLLVTDLEGAGARFSALVNIDYSLVFRQRNLYAFVEYFHNGFGVSRAKAADAGDYPAALRERLARGELFSRMRDYLALGVTLEWHPLVNQAATLIANLNDGGALLQSTLSLAPGDRARIQAGLVLPLGGRGKEFGGLPLADGGLTGGGARSVYLRWIYYP